jgi:hypothetical protein
MATSPRLARRHPSGAGVWAARVLAVAVAVAITAGVRGAETATDPPLDSLQQAVVESLAATPRTTPAQLLDAAVRAADVEAVAAAHEWFGRLVAAISDTGDERLEVLANLGDTADSGGLGRLEKILTTREPAVGKVVAAIREASRLRRRDPRRLAAAVEELRSDSSDNRLAAAEELARARARAPARRRRSG